MLRDRLFILEQKMLQKGGPARHLHREQDEWFYAVEGEFIVEVESDRMTLSPGECSPRDGRRVWAYIGSGGGRLLVGFTPARRAISLTGLSCWRAANERVVRIPLRTEEPWSVLFVISSDGSPSPA